MLDEKDLQAIGQLLNATLDQRFGSFQKKMDQRFEDFEKKIDEKLDQRFEEQHEKIMKEVAVLMDGHFQPQFNLLAEGQKEIVARLDQLEKRMEAVDRIPILEAAVRQHSRRLEELEVRVEDLEKAN